MAPDSKGSGRFAIEHRTGKSGVYLTPQTLTQARSDPVAAQPACPRCGRVVWLDPEDTIDEIVRCPECRTEFAVVVHSLSRRTRPAEPEAFTGPPVPFDECLGRPVAPATPPNYREFSGERARRCRLRARPANRLVPALVLLIAAGLLLIGLLL
jgi:hypothetical protein